MTTTSTDLTGWYDDLAATWGTGNASIYDRAASEAEATMLHAMDDRRLISGVLIVHGQYIRTRTLTSHRRLRLYLDEIERRLGIRDTPTPTPPPCPDCRGSGRKYVHDAFGGCIGTCPRCDGTGGN